MAVFSEADVYAELEAMMRPDVKLDQFQTKMISSVNSMTELQSRKQQEFEGHCSCRNLSQHTNLFCLHCSSDFFLQPNIQLTNLLHSGDTDYKCF